MERKNMSILRLLSFLVFPLFVAQAATADFHSVEVINTSRSKVTMKIAGATGIKPNLEMESDSGGEFEELPPIDFAKISSLSFTYETGNVTLPIGLDNVIAKTKGNTNSIIILVTDMGCTIRDTTNKSVVSWLFAVSGG
jgi:hypothetical protein